VRLVFNFAVKYGIAKSSGAKSGNFNENNTLPGETRFGPLAKQRPIKMHS
jgi:hypothetical protein